MQLKHAKIVVKETRYVEALRVIAEAETAEEALRVAAVEEAGKPEIEDGVE